MIKGNRIIFGYGTIVVNAHTDHDRIEFVEIKSPQEIGETVKGKEFEELRIVTISDKAIQKLDHIVNEDNRVVEACGYIFDFTEYNQKSVDVFNRGLELMRSYNPLTFAC